MWNQWGMELANYVSTMAQDIEFISRNKETLSLSYYVAEIRERKQKTLKSQND